VTGPKANTVTAAPWPLSARLAFGLIATAATAIAIGLGTALSSYLYPYTDTFAIVALLVWLIVILLGAWGEIIRVGNRVAARLAMRGGEQAVHE